MESTTWQVERHRGSAAAFHAREVPSGLGPSVWVFEVDAPALVLGSSQPDDHVDRAAATAAGVEVVRRRSGGGAVLLLPGEIVWVDVIVPVGSPLWGTDVVRSAWWLGDAWVDALSTVVPAPPERDRHVHRGRLVESAWSRHVCFAGVGPGEVLEGGAKLVGVSQRRTRLHARFQCALHRRWQPEVLAGLFRSPGPPAADLTGVTAAVDVDVDDLVPVLLGSLDRAHRRAGVRVSEVAGPTAGEGGAPPTSHR